MIRRLLASAVFLVVAATAPAQVIVGWNFNSNPADANTATGTLTPYLGTGIASLVGGTTNTFAAGSPGDLLGGTDNSGLNSTTYPAQGTNSGTGGVQFAGSTLGTTGGFYVSLDFRQSGTASRYFQLLVTSDGTNYVAPSGGTTTIGTIGAGNTLTAFGTDGIYVNNSGGGSQTFVQAITYNFAPGSVYENNPNFGFRWVSIFDQSGTAPNNYISSNAGTAANYGAGGTARFDSVTIGVNPVPEPTSILFVSLGGLMVVSRKLRRKA